MTHKKVVFYLFLLAGLICIPIVCSAGIAWHSYSSQVFMNAQKSGKNILLYCKASWCHFCQQMSGTLEDARVVKIINARFVPVMIDIDSNAAVAKQYNVVDLPTFIILNSNNETVNLFSGYLTPDELIQKLQ
jgi:thioredoxin-like negative regulator of GroEL